MVHLFHMKKLLYNSVVLFKTHLPSTNKTAEIVDVSLDDLASLVMDNFYHTGVKIDKNNKIEQVFFNNSLEFIDPLSQFSIINEEHILKNDKLSVKENSLLKFNLNFIYNANEDTCGLNEPMCRLLKAVVRGTGLIISPYNQSNYYDLSKEDIINLLRVEKYLEIEDKDTAEEKNEKGLRVIKNRYRILNNKLKKFNLA